MGVRFPLGVHLFVIFKIMIWLWCLALLLILIAVIFLVEEFFNLIFRGYAPLVSSKNKILDEAVRQLISLDLPANAKICELGCGHAGFLRRLEKATKNQKKYKLVGVEVISSVYLLAKLQLLLVGSKIKIVKKNFLKMSLKDVDCFYCYLNGPTMARLSLKLKKEAKPGAILISNQFELPGYEPLKEIQVQPTQRLRIYKL